jgi:hypothetical protein
MSSTQAIPAHIKKAVYSHVVAILAELDEHQSRIGKMTDMILEELKMTEKARKPRRRRP